MKYPYRLFIMLTSICNLNCNGCGHFCELNQEHGSWFISLEELRQNLTIVKEKMPHMNHLMLIGGEPLVHPQFLEICQIIREIFPKMDTTIMTNGIALANYSDEDLIKIAKEYEIEFTSSIYPTTLNLIKEQQERFKKLDIRFGFQGARINFTHFSLNREGLLDKEKQFNKCNLRLKPEFTLAGSKLYSCCVSPRLDLVDIPEFYNDYLDLKDLHNEGQVYDLKMSPPNKCRFCGDKYADEVDIMPWHPQSKVPNEYFRSLKTLFVTDYDLYHRIVDDLDDIYKVVQDPLFKEHLDEVFKIDSLSYLLHRMDNNTIDLFIPITNHTNLNYNGNYYNNLAQQSIIDKCNAYIVCLDTNKINEAIVYNTFTPYKENNEVYSYLYKADNLEMGYEQIQKERYGKLLYALDIESKDLQNPKFLEEELKEYLHD